MNENTPISLQSPSSQPDQVTTGTNTRIIREIAHRASEDKFLTELESWIETAHRWMKITEGPVINVTLTELQLVEVKSVIKTLEGVKEMYEGMCDE